MSVRFAGYAAIFNVVDQGGDVIRPGAFNLPASIPLLWQHQGQPVGVIEEIREDARGLRVIGRVDAPALAGKVAAGDIGGLSFGYRIRAAVRGRARSISALDLMEVSLVTRPMQQLARVHAVLGVPR